VSEASSKTVPAPVAKAPPSQGASGGAQPVAAPLRGLVVRALVAALMLLAAGAFLVNWNELLLSLGSQWTNDAYVRGEPTQISARVGGYVVREGVTDFQAVRAGDVLYEIEDDDYQARVDQAQAALDEAAAAVRVLDAQLALQQQQVAVAQSAIEATGADLLRTRQEERRQSALLNTEGGLRQAWEGAVAGRRRYEAALSGNHAGLAGQQAQFRVLAAQAEQARAALGAQQAALRRARINLGYTRVAAPRDGTVGARQVRPGQYVAPGTMLIPFVPADDVWVVANFQEIQVRRMAVGQAATVTVDAYPGTPLRGRVQSFEPSSQAASSLLPPDHAMGNFTSVVQRVPVRIALDGDQALARRLMPGLSAEARVDTSGSGEGNRGGGGH